MRILLLTTHLRMGGVPIYVVTLAAAMKRLGHEVLVVSSGGDLVERLDREGIPHIRLNIDTKSELHPKVLNGVWKILWLIKKNDINIIHTNTRVTQVIGEAGSLLTGVRHVSTCHGFFKPRLGRQLFGCWGDKVIAISEAVGESLVNDFKIKRTRVELVHNGIDLEASRRTYTDAQREALKKELGLKEGPVIGIIARLSSVKGHKFLVMAMKFVIEKIKDAQLLIVGDGGEEEALKDLSRGLGLVDSVVFTRSVLDTAKVLSIMDVFVLPSVQEGLGLAILEALSCARPVVASSVGGITAAVKDEVTGLLVPPQDVGRLASAILRLLGDKELARRLAANGQRFVCENFSLDEMARKVDALYKSVAT